MKITAYDYAIYGGLHGVVETISPDTIQDEAKPEVFYYRVFIRTSRDYLVNKAGRHFSIVPGMIATVDIKTGEKTVLDYMIKPFNRAKEALRSGSQTPGGGCALPGLHSRRPAQAQRRRALIRTQDVESASKN